MRSKTEPNTDFDFEEQLKFDPSRANIDFVSSIAGDNKNAFDTIFNLIYTSRHPINQRAAGVLETVSENHPDLILPYLDRMIKTFADFRVDGVKRNFAKIFTRTNFNDNQKGHIINLCFDMLQNRKESIAVRAYCMTVLSNISNTIPEIRNELAIIIESEMQFGSGAWKARGRLILKKIYSHKKRASKLGSSI